MRKIIMAIPKHKKQVEGYGTEEGRKKLEEKINKFCQTYPKEAHDSIRSMIRQVALNSVVGINQKTSRLQYRFKGPGGTGKDTLFNFMRDTLGLPLIEISVPTERQGGMESMFGKSWDPITYWMNMQSDDIFGSLIYEFIKSGYVNPIVAFNEMKLDEKSVTNSLKKYMDPTRDELLIKSFRLPYKWSHATVIVASNDDINPDPALETRWETLNLPYATRSTKETVAKEKFEEELGKYTTALADGKSILGKGQEKVVREIFDQLLNDYLDLHDKTTPGARLQSIFGFTAHIAWLVKDSEGNYDKSRILADSRRYMEGKAKGVENTWPKEAEPPQEKAEKPAVAAAAS